MLSPLVIVVNTDELESDATIMTYLVVTNVQCGQQCCNESLKDESQIKSSPSKFVSQVESLQAQVASRVELL